MARLRTDFVRGTITNNPLAIGDTTITSASLASLPEVASPDIAVLILDPAGTAPEVVHVTAHTAAATSATITRAREGSSAKAHIQGTAFVHGLTGDDLPANAFPASVANGDILYGVAASDEYQALALGSAGRFLRVNSAGTGLEYAEVPTIISADAFEWGTKVANRYVANFTSDLLLNNAVFGDLLDAGWTASSAIAPVATTTAAVGDLDAANDAGGTYISMDDPTYRFGSPPVVGGYPLITAIGQVVGTRPTVITAWAMFRFNVTTDGADATGVGIGSDVDAAFAGAGRGYFLTAGATNFELWDGSAATDLGVAADTSAHLLEIEITLAGGTYRVLLDGTERKAAAAVVTDKWPMQLEIRGIGGGGYALYAWGVNYD